MTTLPVHTAKTLLAEDLSVLREYARSVLLRDLVLTPAEQSETELRLAELFAIGGSFRLTKREIVILLFEEVLSERRGCDCPSCLGGGWEEFEGRMSVIELLALFRSEDITACVRELGLSPNGREQTEVECLVEMATAQKLELSWAALGLIAAFSEEALWRICIALGLQAGDKTCMVRALASQVSAVR